MSGVRVQRPKVDIRISHIMHIRQAKGEHGVIITLRRLWG